MALENVGGGAGMSVGEVFASIFLDQKKFDAGLKSSEKSFRAFGDKMNGLGKTMSVGITAPIMGALAASFKYASDLAESTNKVEVAFKGQASAVQAWSQTTLKSFGIASGTSLDMAAKYGDMATAMGLTTEQAADMSMSLVGLAGDLSSFKNIKIDIADTALTSIFTGETESLKQLGIVMTQANLEEFALSRGIKTKIKDMTQAEQTQLRYAYVTAMSKNSIGDFARTQGGAANQTRIFGEALKELAASFGKNLLPAVTPVITKVNELLIGFGKLDPGTQKAIIDIAVSLALLGPAMMVVGNLSLAFAFLTKVLKPLGTIIRVLIAGEGLAGLTAAFPTLASAIGTVGTVLSAIGAAIMSTAGLIVIACVAVAGIAYLIYKNWDTIGPKLAKIWQGIKDSASTQMAETKAYFSEGFANIKQSINDSVGSIPADLKRHFAQSKTAVKSFITNSVAWFNQMPSKLDAAMGRIAHSIWQGIFYGIGRASRYVYEFPGMIKRHFDNSLQKVREWGNEFKTWAVAEIPKILHAISQFFSDMGKDIAQHWDNSLAKIKEWGSNFQTWVVTEVPKALQAIGTFFSQIPGFVELHFDQTMAKVHEWGTKFNQWITVDLPNFIKGIPTAFRKFVGEVYNAGVEMITGFFAGIRDKWNQLIGNLKSLAAEAKGALTQGWNEGAPVNVDPSGNTVTGNEPDPWGIAKGRSHLANGTPFFKGGLSWVGENGPELVNMPRGTKVYNASQSAKMMNSSQSVTHDGVITVQGVNDMGQLVGVTKILAKDIEQGNRRLPARVSTMPSLA